MSAFSNKTVLVTGGASGIGKIFARKALERGARLVVIWDINEEAALQTKAEFEASGAAKPGAFAAYKADVSNLDDIQSVFAQMRADMARAHGGGDVDILFNNAGIVVGKAFEQHTHTDIRRTVDINVSALMHLALEALPGMTGRGGHIINIASAAGLVPTPHMSVYSASKWAVTGWSESLRLEMERLHPNVKVTTVAPSYINTGMFAGARPALLTYMLKPETVAERVMRAVERDKILIRLPWTVNLLPIMRGLLPARLFDWFVGKGLRIYTSMDKFSGRG